MILCIQCGQYSTESNFCPNCGGKFLNNLSEITTQSPSSSSNSTVQLPGLSSESKQHLMTYEEFRKRKESSRLTSLPLSSSKSKRIKSKKSEGKSAENVKIQIGIKEFQESVSSLKILKGRSLPVAVKASINAKGLLEAALAKHSKHFRSFTGNTNEYVLLYPDNTVVNLLPGSSQFFSLKDYKEDLGKPYSKMSLHLCKLECLRKSEAESKSDEDFEEFEDTDVTSHGQDESEHELLPVNIASNTQSIVPFLCKADAQVGATNGANRIEHKEIKMTCPTCYLDFPAKEIEAHADVCAEQFDPVGSINCESGTEIADDQDAPELAIEQASVTVNINGTGNLEKIKEVVSNLRQSVELSNINRISIRRRYAYQDYLDAVARQKMRKRFHQNGMLTQ